jgi:UDP-N-acetylglucosamine--N-acetylmuramyl-(pentapeptide) pyrophosphoryl-undecaprenol N-acetylglucosamine transferase
VLVPSPNVAGDHQTKNAAAMVDEGASLLIAEDELEDALTDRIPDLMNNDVRLQEMSDAALKLSKPNAATTIANELFELAKQKQTDE